jgi:hypothetical protein
MDWSRNSRSIRVIILVNNLHLILLIDFERAPKSFSSRNKQARLHWISSGRFVPAHRRTSFFPWAPFSSTQDRSNGRPMHRSPCGRPMCCSPLPYPVAARVCMVRRHRPFPRSLCSLSSFPSDDNSASCAACHSSSGECFAGNKHQTSLFPSLVLVRKIEHPNP